MIWLQKSCFAPKCLNKSVASRIKILFEQESCFALQKFEQKFCFAPKMFEQKCWFAAKMFEQKSCLASKFFKKSN